MTGQDLKNSILQLAIQGKLVPQDPHDEPASKLLERIKAEKERLIAEKKIKKEKPLAPITDDEKPFEIPESWEWCRLGEVCSILGDGIHGTPIYDETGKIYFINGNNLSCGKIVIKPDTKTVNEDEAILHYRQLTDRTVLVSINGTIGNIAFYDNEPVILGKSACYFNLLDKLSRHYFKLLLSTDYFIKYAKASATGSTIKNVPLAGMKNFILPLPPLEEQQRIVAKIEELMPLVEEYDKAQRELDDINGKLPEQLKQSILQEAIMGKLGTNNPDDEPASELLKRIRKEKAQLIADKKIKKEKPLPEITDEEKPFDIPENWVWCRLGEICTKVVDGDHNPPKGISEATSYIMLSSKNVNNDSLVDLDDVRYLTKEVFEKEDLRTTARINDILFTTVGSLGRSCIIEEKQNLCFQRSVSVLTTLIYNYYLKRVLDSPFVHGFVTDNATGTAQKGFYLNQLVELLIPLPPLAEQHRIVEKLDALLPQISELAKQ